MSENLPDRLKALAENHQNVNEGAYLFHQGDAVRSLFVVDTGAIDLIRHQPDGNRIVLQRAAEQSVLAEASVYSAAYHCSAIAFLPSRLTAIGKSRFLAALREDFRLADLWAAHLAHQVQAARYRSETLTRKTVAERLDAWLAWHEDGLPEKGHWRTIADQIGVSPEALYRELAKRRN